MIAHCIKYFIILSVLINGNLGLYSQWAKIRNNIMHSVISYVLLSHYFRGKSIIFLFLDSFSQKLWFLFWIMHPTRLWVRYPNEI